MEEEKLSKSMMVFIGIVLLIIFTLVLAFTARVTCFNYVERHEFPYMFDSYTGEIKEINKQGYVFSYPIIQKVSCPKMSANGSRLYLVPILKDQANFKQHNLIWKIQDYLTQKVRH